MPSWTRGLDWIFVTSTNKSRISFWPPSTRNCLRLSGLNVDAQVGHKNFEHDKGKSPGFLAFITGYEGAFFDFNSASKHFAFYPDHGKERIPQKLKMEEVTIIPDSVFIGHRYL